MLQKSRGKNQGYLLFHFLKEEALSSQNMVPNGIRSNAKLAQATKSKLPKFPSKLKVELVKRLTVKYIPTLKKCHFSLDTGQHDKQKQDNSKATW